MVEIHESVFTLKSRFTGTIEILVITGNTPNVEIKEPRHSEFLISRFGLSLILRSFVLASFSIGLIKSGAN